MVDSPRIRFWFAGSKGADETKHLAVISHGLNQIFRNDVLVHMIFLLIIVVRENALYLLPGGSFCLYNRLILKECLRAAPLRCGYYSTGNWVR